MRRTVPIIIDGVFPQSTEDRVRSLLAAPELIWKAPCAIRRTTRGRSVQLADCAEHDKPAMQSLTRLLASAVYEQIASVTGLPPAEQIAPQVFPVVMLGDRRNPPHQKSHRDSAALYPLRSNSRRLHPLWTCVYYARADRLTGGELVLVELSASGYVDRQSIDPVTNRLVAFPGTWTHRVAELYAGTRVSVQVLID